MICLKKRIILVLALLFTLLNVEFILSGYCPGSCACYDSQNCYNYEDTGYGGSCAGTYSCGTDGCSGGQYVDYYCSGGYCYSQNLERDGSSTYCACLGAGIWNLGGEVSATTCCGDDAGEYKRTRACNSWCTSASSDDACCNANSDCVYSSTCYNSGVCYADDAYCNSGTWYEPDAGKLYCDSCIGANHWNLGGEIISTPCCGDDSGENYINQGIGNTTVGASCCCSPFDCIDRNGRCRHEPAKELTCMPWDGVDDDCDGKTDCSDTDCSASVDCDGCTPEDCDNGVDDDCDHSIDCADNDCIGDAACATCNNGGPAVPEDCDNGMDDDCDGKTDCADNDCIGVPPLCTNCKKEDCDNGVDDDCDGLVDHLDWDCPGCEKGTTLCVDGQCCEDCDACDDGSKGCVAQGDKCTESEGCECSDCYGQRDSCAIGLTCDAVYEKCLCPGGTKVCEDGDCKLACNRCGNDVLEPGEECDDANSDMDPADFGQDGNACPVGCNGTLTCAADCTKDSSTCTCPGCVVKNGDGVCCVNSGDGICDSECTARADADCVGKCTHNLGDCCDDTAGNGCDLDCVEYKDPDCSASCLNSKDGCCNANADGKCDSDCDNGIDPDCPVCTNVGSTDVQPDCCDERSDNVCDPDCIPGVDPDCKCGNKAIDAGETCDRTEFAEQNCATFGFDSGMLSCFASGMPNECHFDTSGCFKKSCVSEDGVCGSGEDCRCPDCLGKQGGCSYNSVCDGTASCKCKDGTTLCGDGSCKLPEECVDFKCVIDGICALGEGCQCADCFGKSDGCMASSTCIDNRCTACSISKVYWPEDCIGSDVSVTMTVEGSAGCDGKTVILDLKEKDGKSSDDVGTFQAVFKDGKAEYKWETKWYDECAVGPKGKAINDCTLCAPVKANCDAKKYSKNPKSSAGDVLEYYFVANIGTQFVDSEVLKVHYCIPECDADCDTFIDAELRNTPGCVAKIGSGDVPTGDDKDYPYLKDSKLVIDANALSEYCEKCDKSGLSPGQSTCAKYYDCTPEWWKKLSPAELNDLRNKWSLKGITESAASDGLDWGECGESKGATGMNRSKVTSEMTRNRLVCPPDLQNSNTYETGYDLNLQCCGGPNPQANCYCEIPTFSDKQLKDLGVNCGDANFRPTEIKACLKEEKFPFFTNMNILFVVLILIGFYIWKTKLPVNRARKRTKK